MKRLAAKPSAGTRAAGRARVEASSRGRSSGGTAKAPAPAFFDRRAGAVAQRTLCGGIDRSPRVAALGVFVECIHDSPYMVAQRLRLGGTLGVAVMRGPAKAGVELPPHGLEPARRPGYQAGIRQGPPDSPAPMSVGGHSRADAAAVGQRCSGIPAGANAQIVMPVQRRAYIGSGFKSPDEPCSEKARELHEDEHVRRFRDQQELETFANGGDVEGIGLLEGKTWIRLPPTMLVLGEEHADPKAPAIIKATGIKKFRYEGFSHHSQTRLAKNPELKQHVEDVNQERLERMGLDGGDQPVHAAEHALPKYARALADVIKLAEKQSRGETVGEVSVAAGSPLGKRYSLAKALIASLLDALIYCRSYEGKFLAHPLKGFYHDNKVDVDLAIQALAENRRNGTVPNFKILALNKGRLDELTTAYETAARAKLGLRDEERFGRFKQSLDLQSEPNVTLTDRARQLDYLRDASLLETVRKAKKDGDRLFVMGDAHRKKLRPLIEELGLAVKRDTDFLDEQMKENREAWLRCKEPQPVSDAMRDDLLSKEILPMVKTNPGKRSEPKVRREEIGKTYRLLPKADDLKTWEGRLGGTFEWKVEGAKAVGAEGTSAYEKEARDSKATLVYRYLEVTRELETIQF